MAKLLYKKIEKLISEQIENKVYLPGDKLPSERQLSLKMNVSVGTIRKAYANLEDQGLIIPKERSGYYVKSSHPVPLSFFKTDFPIEAPSKVSVLETAISVMRSAAGKGLVQLGSAIPNVKGKAVAQLHQDLKRHSQKVPNYEEDPQGFLPLRRQLARRSVGSGKPFHPDEIVITAGCQEALTIALRCIARSGDIIAVESPCYYAVLQALECLELKAVEIPVSPVDGIDTDILDSILQTWPVKGILLNPAFSNPSGYLCSEQKKQTIAKIILKYDIPLIEDDIFAELGFSGKRPRTIQSYDEDGRVILCSSISKTISPDLRIGWMIPGRYLKKARTMKYISTLCSPSHTQYALASFLSTHQFERHVRSMISDYEKKQQTLRKAIKQYLPADTSVTRPEGGFLCWLRLPEEVDGLELYYRAVENGITIAPGQICSPTGKFKNYIRLNYAVASTDRIEFSIKRLGKLV